MANIRIYPRNLAFFLFEGSVLKVVNGLAVLIFKLQNVSVLGDVDFVDFL